MNRRSIKLYILLMTLLLNIFIASDLPKSHAKYIKEDQKTSSTYLKKMSISESEYNVNGDSMYLNSSSTYNKAIFEIRFNKNNIMYEDEVKDEIDKSDIADYYRLHLVNNKDNCKIIDDTIKTNGTIISLSDDSVTIKYISNSSDTISLKVRCDVTDDELVDDTIDNVYLEYYVDEHLQNYQGEYESEFTYLKYHKLITLSEYYVGDRIPPVEEVNIYEEAINALNSKYASYSTDVKDTLTNYFNTVFTVNIDNDSFKLNKDNLLGFSFTEGDSNVYSFNDNYLGYALTWNNAKANLSDSIRNFAFSSSVKADRESAFSYYIDTYGTDVQKANKDKIINYINTYANGIDDAIDNKVIGIISSLTDVDTTTYSLTIDNALINYIDGLSRDYIQMENNTYTSDTMWNNNFVLALRNQEAVGDPTYDKMKDDSKMFQAIYNDSDIKESVITNSKENVLARNGDITIFSDYHIVTVNDESSGDSRSTVVNVYSDTDNTYGKVYYLTQGTALTLARSVNSTESNQSVIDTINQIDSLMNPDTHTDITSIDEIGSVYGMIYSVTIENGIEYTTYVLR